MLRSLPRRRLIEISDVVSTLCKPSRHPQRELFRADEDIERDLKAIVGEQEASGALCFTAHQWFDPKQRNMAMNLWCERRMQTCGRAAGLPVFISGGEHFFRSGETMDVFADVLRFIAVNNDSFSGFIKLPAAELEKTAVSSNLSAAFASTGIQLPNRVVYCERVKHLVPEHILAKVQEKVSASQWGRVQRADPAFVAALTGIIYEVIQQSPLRAEVEAGPQVIVDPLTKLKLPPEPRDSFKLRLAKYGRRLTASEYLRLEWSDYTSEHLMYAEFLRNLDPALYFALAYEARRQTPAVPLADFMLQNGVLAKAHVVRPPPGLERQCRLLQSVRLRSRGEDLVSIAKELEIDLV